MEKNYYLNKSARDAYRSYLLAYASHSHKDIFNVHELDLQVRLGLAWLVCMVVLVLVSPSHSPASHTQPNQPPQNQICLPTQAVARGFGFSVPPRVDVNLSAKGDKKGRLKARDKQGKDKRFSSGHKFSASNPYGKREAGDARQFVR